MYIGHVRGINNINNHNNSNLRKQQQKFKVNGNLGHWSTTLYSCLPTENQS